MFADTDFHLCVLTPDPLLEGTNQHSLPQYTMLQIATEQTHHSFLYFMVIFYLKGNNLCVISDFICRKWFRKWCLNFAGLLLEMSTIFYDLTRETCHLQHVGWRTTTTFCELWTLAILQAIWDQIRLRWN